MVLPGKPGLAIMLGSTEFNPQVTTKAPSGGIAAGWGFSQA